MAMPIELEAERLYGLPTLPTGWEIAATGVGPAFEVLVVAADAPFDARRVGESSRYRLYRRAGKSFEGFEFVAAGRAAYMFVQPIDSENFLLVTPWIYEGVENAGHIWSSDGAMVGRLPLGQGIEHVQTSARSDVWVGYTDEGIFSAMEPGLACFDRTGKRVFSFADSIANGDHGNVPHIDDCYALNVTSENEVWVYYYSAFPLVRLVDRELAAIWPRVPGLGARAFAVGERSVLFAGDYGSSSAITRYFPESGRSEMGHAIGDGLPLEFTRAIGRADRLYLVGTSAVWLLRAD
jgi:hypothetical protein